MIQRSVVRLSVACGVGGRVPHFTHGATPRRLPLQSRVCDWMSRETRVILKLLCSIYTQAQ